MSDIEQYMARPAAPASGRTGQGTAVEQSRAVEEVRASMVMARQFPRIEAAARSRIKEACETMALAERAFYAVPKGGTTISGPSIHLAKEVARCWGNITHGLVEMRRDDEFGQSEMQAWAWELETNHRVSSTFIVPHQIMASKKRKDLVDLQDIYTNNANNGARRLREMIFTVIPVSVVEYAKQTCAATLKHGGGVPMAQRIEDIVKRFAQLGVIPDQLERNRNRSMADWTEHDIAQLNVLGGSLYRNEITREDAFPDERMTLDALAKQAPKAAAKPAAPAPDPVWEQEQPEPAFEESAEWQGNAVPFHADGDRDVENVGRSWPQVRQPGSGGVE